MDKGGVRKVVARVSCLACRSSKVRCDLEFQPRGADCTRCVRLRVHCIPNGPSRRGTSVTPARLGPALRALLTDDALAVARVPEPAPEKAVPHDHAGHGSAQVMAACGSGHLHALLPPQHSHEQQQQPEHHQDGAQHQQQPVHFELCGSVGASPAQAAQLANALGKWALLGDLLKLTGSERAKVYFLKADFILAMRHGSYEHVHLTMRHARELQLPLDKALTTLCEVKVAMHSAAAIPPDSASGAAPPSLSSPLPDFIAAWFHSGYATVMRVCEYGVVRWVPNRTMLAAYEHAGVAAQLLAVHGRAAAAGAQRGGPGPVPSGGGAFAGADTAEVQHSVDNAMLEVLFLPSDRPAICAMLTSVWGATGSGSAPGVVQRAPLGWEGQTSTAVRPRLGAFFQTPQRAHMRLMTDATGCMCWETYQFRAWYGLPPPPDAIYARCVPPAEGPGEPFAHTAPTSALARAAHTGAHVAGARASPGAPLSEGMLGRSVGTPSRVEGREEEEGEGDDDAEFRLIAESIDIEALLSFPH